MTPLRFVLGALLSLLAVVPYAHGEPPPITPPDGAGETFFAYPLRSGESLNDVARVFRVPAQELAELNHIGDPSRLQLGQLIRVPNVFARETAQLHAERQQLIDQKSAAERAMQERDRAAAAVDTQLRQLQAEKDSIARELATMERWRKTALGSLLLFAIALGWALKTLLDRTQLVRRQTSLVAENAALLAAKEKYRQAASQLEFRYQGLYRGKGEPPKIAIADGVSKLRAIFHDGATQVERHLTAIRAEREKQQQLVEAGEKARAWLLHPLRELLDRHRLKYHTP